MLLACFSCCHGDLWVYLMPYDDMRPTWQLCDAPASYGLQHHASGFSKFLRKPDAHLPVPLGHSYPAAETVRTFSILSGLNVGTGHCLAVLGIFLLD